MVKLVALVLTVTLGGGVLPNVEIPAPDYGDITETRQLAQGVLTERTITIQNGDAVVFGSLTDAPETVVASVRMPGGTLSCYGGGWDVTPLEEGIYHGTFLVADGSDGSSWMAYTPQAWEYLENRSRQLLPGRLGYLRVTREAQGFLLELVAPAVPAGAAADFTTVYGRTRLLQWERTNCAELWANYANAGSGRWCFDGYYWPSPTNYVPAGENVYYPMPAAYLCRSFLALAGHDRLAYDLGLATMAVMADRQNEHGFFPTESGSLWLSGDYGVGPGFYDTRFNTDLIIMFLDAHEIYGMARFEEVLRNYAGFFAAFAAKNHTETVSGGWLVEDYGHPNGCRTTHTSLNHQLAEILALYRMADRFDDFSLRALADRMLVAIEDTEASWVRADSNLHYAVYPARGYGGTDYPYLTYNDLYDMQAYLESARGVRSAALDRLMAAKKTWMDANGVTDYKK